MAPVRVQVIKNVQISCSLIRFAPASPSQQLEMKKKQLRKVGLPVAGARCAILAGGHNVQI